MNNYNNNSKMASDNYNSSIDMNSHHFIRYKEEDEVTDSEEEIGDESRSFTGQGHSIKMANPTKPSAGGFQRSHPASEQQEKPSSVLKPGPPPVPGLKPG